MKEFQGVSALGTSWAPKDSVAYEVQVAIVTRMQLGTLLGHLADDKRHDGFGGRAVMADIAAFGLQKEDRLEPSPSARTLNSDLSQIDWHIAGHVGC